MEEYMLRKCSHGHLGLFILMAVIYWGTAPPPAGAVISPATVRSNGTPDINGSPNWAYSPLLPKFVDGLPGLCGSPVGTDPDGANDMGQCLPIAVKDTTTYPGSDYYEIEIVQFRERMHSTFPALNDPDKMAATAGGTLLRGYRQTNVDTNDPAYVPHYLGPIIVADKDRPVRIKFTNSLPIGEAGKLFIPTDTTVMGSGPGPLYDRGDARTDDEVCNQNPELCFSQNRADLHLHGGRTPWISDGTAHQWITPVGEIPTGANPPDPRDPYYSKGVSVAYVPDMWYDANGNTIGACAGKTFCDTNTYPGATNNPGEGSQTYYFTNAQSARLMFYHEHSWGITRLGVYVGGAAGYIVTDNKEQELIDNNLIPGPANTIPLIIQDKTFVDASTILDTDPTWVWGSNPGTLYPWDPDGPNNTAGPVTGDLWWPHIYVPAQNPFNPNLSGVNDFGRWHYGPWFWPPTEVPNGPIPNPYYGLSEEQPPQIPGTPNPSWGAEAFLDTPVINGTAYPKLNVAAGKYRFRILNAAHDRFWNLQFYVADPAASTEVKMVPAIPATADVGDPDFLWPADSREGGVPDPTRRGPAMVQIGTEGGFLPAPVVLPNRPVNWNVDPTTFTAGLVLQQNQGGGTLFLGPAERADVIVDFSAFAGRTLILYNDSPAPFPALDPHYDYYTNSPVYSDIGGAPASPSDPNTPTTPGFGPNTRTIMQIVVGDVNGNPVAPDTTPGPINAVPANLADLRTAFKPVSAGGLGVFDEGQEPIIVGQSAYNDNYNTTFPATWPNWGISRITDRSISFMTPDGGVVSAYPMEPKAIQDEMGEVYDEFGRMSAKLGLELAKTTALNQTFVLQNFVDPSTEIVAKDQVQIWKITHNGVDTHPVHFHLFEVQLLNRVGWDGFMYLPDPNELGWKDTVRVSPLEDTIVALRPAKVPTPFNVPNSLRPLNPAYPLGGPAGFTNLDPVTAQQLPSPTTNEIVNFGHEYLWHCHILSHEEQDMMRTIIYNTNSVLYTDNGTSGFWQWNRGDWSQIAATDPSSVAAYGTHAYAKMADGLYEWNSYTWKRINTVNPTTMLASESGLYADFAGTGASAGLFHWKGTAWTKIHASHPSNMAASGSNLYVTFTGWGLYRWNGSVWKKIHSTVPATMVASTSGLYADFAGVSGGLFHWNNTAWTKIHGLHPFNMVASESNLYVNFTGWGLYQWNGSLWRKMNSEIPTAMAPSGPDFYASFSGGLFKWNGNQNWTMINPSIPAGITASGSILYARFTVGDVQKYELGSWSPLLNTTPVTNMVTGF